MHNLEFAGIEELSTLFARKKVSPVELTTLGACAAAGAALAWWYLRAREPAPVRLLRAAHTGSVNDYAAYAVAGMLAVIAVLTLT